MLDNVSILVTGGTGSFGQKFVEHLLEDCNPREVVIFSRDEFKQSEMARRFSPHRYPIRYFLGDVRDRDRLKQAFVGIDYVVHAAALKQVPALEYNPFEAVRTNILGTQNVVEAALERGVKKVVALSTDKAVSPSNLYGATKLTAEKLVVAANTYVRHRDISFSVVRYGNVIGSRGSVVPYFSELVRSGVRELPVTDDRMTRFWITLDEAVALVMRALGVAAGGEIFIPKIPSLRMLDLVTAFLGEPRYRSIGIRPGEKLHESLIGENESRSGYDMGDYYVILPQFEFQNKAPHLGTPLGEDFVYRSDTNDQWLLETELRELLERQGFLLPTVAPTL
jgi:UDP-N-acetylglucosamine 4,6-dehydratase/5-epimerase